MEDTLNGVTGALVLLHAAVVSCGETGNVTILNRVVMEKHAANKSSDLTSNPEAAILRNAVGALKRTFTLLR